MRVRIRVVQSSSEHVLNEWVLFLLFFFLLHLFNRIADVICFLLLVNVFVSLLVTYQVLR